MFGCTHFPQTRVCCKQVLKGVCSSWAHLHQSGVAAHLTTLDLGWRGLGFHSRFGQSLFSLGVVESVSSHAKYPPPPPRALPPPPPAPPYPTPPPSLEKEPKHRRQTPNTPHTNGINSDDDSADGADDVYRLAHGQDVSHNSPVSQHQYLI